MSVSLTIGDMAQAFILQRQNGIVKADLLQLSTEMTTGLASDPAAHLHADFAPLASIENSLAQLNGYHAVNSEAGFFAGAMQTAMGAIDERASQLSADLIAASTGGSSIRLDAVANDGGQRFQEAVAALNTRFGDRSLFAGVETSSPALVDAETILSTLSTLVAGAQTAGEVESALDTWFNDSAGYEAVAYRGGTPLTAVAIAPGETAALDVTAMDPALRDTLKGLAMAALLGRGVLAGKHDARADLAKRAGENLLESQTARVQLAARLGTTEAHIADADTRNTAEISSLQIARLGMLSVDPYETAARLEATQSQLESLYAITARMSRLSLMDYL